MKYRDIQLRMCVCGKAPFVRELCGEERIMDTLGKFDIGKKKVADYVIYCECGRIRTKIYRFVSDAAYEWNYLVMKQEKEEGGGAP